MPSWANISSKAPWSFVVSPHLTKPCFLARKSHGRPSLQTHTGCGPGVRLLSPRVGMAKAPHTTQRDSDIHVFLSLPHHGHLLLSWHRKPDTRSPGVCFSICICVLTTPGPGYVPIPTRPALLVFRSCSLHIPGRRSGVTGSVWRAAGWPGLGQEGRMQLMLLGAAVTTVVKKRCGLLWVQKDQTLVMVHDRKCALAKAELVPWHQVSIMFLLPFPSTIVFFLGERKCWNHNIFISHLEFLWVFLKIEGGGRGEGIWLLTSLTFSFLFLFLSLILSNKIIFFRWHNSLPSPSPS